MRKTDFTKALTEYFSIYLPTTCGVSPNTTNSYRDTFKQLLLFFQEKKGISANYIELRYLNMELVSEFLDWLETSRHIAVTTRNQRLAAIKAFAHFVHSASAFSRTNRQTLSSACCTLNCTDSAISKPAGATSSVRV